MGVQALAHGRVSCFALAGGVRGLRVLPDSTLDTNLTRRRLQVRGADWGVVCSSRLLGTPWEDVLATLLPQAGI